MVMKKIIQDLLAFFAKKILAKYKPKIIGITGSVGKTSTKEAVFLVVNQKYKARKSEKSFNGELGLPLSIIGIKNDPQKSIFSWFKVFVKALGLLIWKVKYPEFLVLEYGVDHVGDMDKLLAIAHPNIALITSIGVSHYEFFKDVEAIETEKGKIAQILRSDEILIVNADNQKAFNQKNKSSAKVLSYGFENTAEIKAEVIEMDLHSPYGATINFTTLLNNIIARINCLGEPHYYAVTAAVAVAEALHIEADLIVKGLIEYKPSPGRLNIIPGIKHSTIIDDSYNASPDSMRQAIRLFDRLEAPNKIAILGTMRELGALTESSHREIGEYIASIKPNYLITVAEGGKIISDSAILAGMSSGAVMHFNTSDEAKKIVQDLIQPETLILVKGSQNTVRLEKVVKEIMAEPMKAKELLVRQYGDWLK